MCFPGFTPARARASIESSSVAEYLEGVRYNLATGNATGFGRNFNSPSDVSPRLKGLIEQSIGCGMSVWVCLEEDDTGPTIDGGVLVLDALQKYSQPKKGEGCGAWFDYAVNTVGHVFRLVMNFMTFGCVDHSEWTKIQKDIAGKYVGHAKSAMQKGGIPINDALLQSEARYFAREILAKCLDAYADPELPPIPDGDQSVCSQARFIELMKWQMKPEQHKPLG